MSVASVSLSRPRPALTLWRHVIRELVPPTAIGFLVFTFLMLMRWLLQISRLWIEYGAELSQVLWAVVYSLPHIVVLTLPMGILVGGLIAFGRMSADFEIVALRALGVSLLHLLPPVLIFSSTIWLLTTYMFLVTLPWGNQSLREMQWDTITSRAFSQEVKPRVFDENFPGLVLYVEDIVDQGAEWRGVFAARTDRDPPTIIRAERAFPVIDEEARETYLILENGTVLSSAEEPTAVTILRFERREMLVWSEERDSVIGEIGKDGRSMTLEELATAIIENEARGQPAWDLRVEVHKKFAFPFACIVLGLASLPLGISTQRQTTATGFAVGTGVIIVYYFFAQNGEQRADIGQVPPWLGVWIGNIVLGVAGATLLWMKTQERDMGIVRRLRAWGEIAYLRGHEIVRTHVLHRATGERLRPRLGFPRTLDRYVLRNYCAVYLLAFFSLLVVVVAATWIEKASYVQHPEVIPRYLQYYVWQILHDVVPVAAVITVLATFSLMTKRFEVTAALAGGISLLRLVAPILVPALALTAVQYAVTDSILPYATRQAEIAEQEMHPSGGPTLQRLRTWVFSEGRRVFHFADYVADPAEFRALHIYFLSDGPGGVSQMWYARQAFWNGQRWEGHDGWRRFYTSTGDGDDLRAGLLEEFKFSALPLEEDPGYFNQTPLQPAEMSLRELRQHIDLLRDRGYDTHRSLVDLHLKIAEPAIVLVMTLVGIPFAFRMGRHGALTGVGIAIGMAIVYYIVFGIFRALGYGGQLPPPLAAWAPHLLFVAFGGYLALGVRT